MHSLWFTAHKELECKLNLDVSFSQIRWRKSGKHLILHHSCLTRLGSLKLRHKDISLAKFFKQWTSTQRQFIADSIQIRLALDLKKFAIYIYSFTTQLKPIAFKSLVVHVQFTMNVHGLKTGNALKLLHKFMNTFKELRHGSHRWN